jgi:NAD(P)-dependent dehydrogenase (short-subunit alcohol dehydrogenase family)
MPQTVAIIGIGDQFARALADTFTKRGWSVFAPEIDPRSVDSIRAAADRIDSVDLLVNCVDDRHGDVPVQTTDFDAIRRLYDVNGIGAVRALEAFLPRMSSGLKRLCFVTDADAAVGIAEGTADAGRRMAKAAVRMAIAITSNYLAPEGYTFRVFAPDRGDIDTSAAAAFDYFTNDRDDELRLTAIDHSGKEMPL